MSDVATIRAEIKAWEREFKDKYNRDPTVQDIKEQGEVAEKYKLYKTLLKNASAVTISAPSTPPRPRPHLSHSTAIMFSPRAVRVTASLPKPNPFSPFKDTVKPRHTLPDLMSNETNPLTTSARDRSGSGDLSPNLLSPIQAGRCWTTLHVPVTSSTVSRARKRFRGEPVSPSPSKLKRRRFYSQSTFPFTAHPSCSSSSDDEGRFADNRCDIPFIDNSPAKAPTGRKSFKLLFEDISPPGGLSARSQWPRESLFSRGSTDEPCSKRGQTSSSTKTDSAPTKVVNDRGYISSNKKLEPDDVFRFNYQTERSDVVQVPEAAHVDDEALSGLSQARASARCSLTKSNAASQCPDFSPTRSHQMALLPPSPPPASFDSCHPHDESKANVGIVGRKKHKSTEEGDRVEDEDKNAATDIPVKVFKRALHAHADVHFDSDPILSHIARSTNPDTWNMDHGRYRELEKFEVTLPDKLRHVLAILPPRRQHTTEECLVHRLLYGARVNHYDASKGGEIWTVGEGEEDNRAKNEDEGEWEGEPVSWEVGEL